MVVYGFNGRPETTAMNAAMRMTYAKDAILVPWVCRSAYPEKDFNSRKNARRPRGKNFSLTKNFQKSCRSEKKFAGATSGIGTALGRDAMHCFLSAKWSLGGDLCGKALIL